MEQMQAVVFRSTGGPEVLHVETVRRPRPRPGEVLVRVHAAGVNPVDDVMRRSQAIGAILRAIRKPMIPGLDFAGTVVEVGRGVEDFREGDPVFGAVSTRLNGTYAEYVRVGEGQLARKPERLSFREAAGVPVVGLTALQMIRDKAKVVPGDRVLVNGAAGGVGSFALQLARTYGANVTAECGPDHVQLMRDLGADAVLDYTRDDVHKAGRFDVIIDAVSKLPIDWIPDLLEPRGRYVSTLPRRELIQHAATHPFEVQKFSMVRFRPRRTDLEALARLLDDGRIRVVIDQVAPLEAAPDVHRLLQQGHTAGKRILSMLPS
ncbi:MAG: NAD(P)-dependent alcohol dehydrogenase [Myxococcaceae bacterium]